MLYGSLDERGVWGRMDTRIIVGVVADAELCLTLWDPTDCSPPGSSVHGFSQTRILEWVAISFSRIHVYI